MPSLMDKYSDEEFIEIVLTSNSYKDCLFNLGYASKSGSSINKLKEKIGRLNIDVSHFTSTIPIARTEENIFISDSTVDQKTLRKWYKKGNYTEYKCTICGQEPFWNGKELTLILDHINGYNRDDRLENLRWVCPNCNYQLETTNGKNINHGQHELNYCVDCGKIISKKATRCIKCNAKYKTQEEVNGISRDELKSLIRNKPFTQIGKEYSVSDNAIRKWCDKYNLPRKASEIKSYTDEQWQKI